MRDEEGRKKEASKVKQTTRQSICTRKAMQESTIEMVVSPYKESRNKKPMYDYMLPNLSPSPNLYKVQSV